MPWTANTCNTGVGGTATVVVAPVVTSTRTSRSDTWYSEIHSQPAAANAWTVFSGVANGNGGRGARVSASKRSIP